jgi:hypothetical protein
MKKFLALSAIVGLAGIGVGVARQNEPATATVETAEATSTTVTTIPLAATSPTIGKAAAKTTATTARRVSTPTGATTATTTRPVVATTPTTAATTTTTLSGPPPTCTVTPDKASIAESEPQALRLTSNLQNTPVKIFALYPGNPNTMHKLPQQLVHQATTSADGSDTWNFVGHPSNSIGRVQVWVNFYPVGEKQIGSLCSTSFQAV